MNRQCEKAVCSHLIFGEIGHCGVVEFLLLALHVFEDLDKVFAILR